MIEAYWDWAEDGMYGDENGCYVLRGDFDDLQRQLSEKQEDLDDWIHSNRIDELQRQLAEVTRERDQYKAAHELADALRNRKTK